MHRIQSWVWVNVAKDVGMSAMEQRMHNLQEIWMRKPYVESILQI